MLGIVKDNKIIPLTTDTGAGAPVGTLIQQYKKKPMSGYLYCDGSTFDENVYPALYMYLGTNVLPDYRECVMVGAEQNTTDTIATHDVYGEGEFKDDQLQNIKIDINDVKIDSGTDNDKGIVTGGVSSVYLSEVLANSNSGRLGTTTHGKQKAVYVYIKATSGLAENAQDNVLNDVKDYVDGSNSYSTQEVKTGGTWIDGKPIYRKVVLATGSETLQTTVLNTVPNWSIRPNNIDKIIHYETQSLQNYYNNIILYNDSNNQYLQFMSINVSVTVNSGDVLILEYTKTTD